MFRKGGNMKYQRQIDLQQYINVKGTATIQELLDVFHISKATLNRDLTDLENDGQIHKVHGGVVSNVSSGLFELPITKKEIYNRQYKEWIAKKACSLIHSNQSIILDSGSTIYYLAKELVKRQDLENLTVITADLKVAYTLADQDQIALFVLGGMKHEASYDLYGSNIVSLLDSINADVYFMATSAFDEKIGVTHTNMDDVNTKKAMMRNSKRVVLCTDSSKHGLVKRWSICDMNKIDTVISDINLEENAVQTLKEQCQEVILVSE